MTQGERQAAGQCGAGQDAPGLARAQHRADRHAQLVQTPGRGELGQQVREFRDMVKALHRAGIEVILDVVFNHTDEGNHLGPLFSFAGFDNRNYYYLDPADRQFGPAAPS